MDATIFAVALLLIVGGVAFIVRPFVVAHPSAPVGVRDPRKKGQRLLSEKEAVYAAIKDLEFEHLTGKIADEDYTELRDGYRAKALNIINALEQGQAEIDEESVLHCVKCGHANPVDSNFCEACGERLPSERACPACSMPVMPGDRFCRACGGRM